MLEQRTEYKVEINFSNLTISVAKITIILNDGVELSRSIHRAAFVPGEVQLVKIEMGIGDGDPFIVFLNAIWTPEVVQAYNDMLAASAAA